MLQLLILLLLDLGDGKDNPLYFIPPTPVSFRMMESCTHQFLNSPEMPSQKSSANIYWFTNAYKMMAKLLKKKYLISWKFGKFVTAMCKFPLYF